MSLIPTLSQVSDICLHILLLFPYFSTHQILQWFLAQRLPSFTDFKPQEGRCQAFLAQDYMLKVQYSVHMNKVMFLIVCYYISQIFVDVISAIQKVYLEWSKIKYKLFVKVKIPTGWFQGARQKKKKDRQLHF